MTFDEWIEENKELIQKIMYQIIDTLFPSDIDVDSKYLDVPKEW